MSRVTCHMSHVTCHVSHVTCHIFFFDKVVKLIGEGFVINGATPSSFPCIEIPSLLLPPAAANVD